VAQAHGTDSVLMINDGTSLRDITPYTKSIDFNRSRDANDVTTMGMNTKAYRGGLRNGEVRISGVWDDTVSAGPRKLFTTLMAVGAPSTATAVEWYPEGNTTGAEKSAGLCVLTQYDEGSPIDDMVAFTATLKLSGDVTDSVVT
jgi:hypothetical protein